MLRLHSFKTIVDLAAQQIKQGKYPKEGINFSSQMCYRCISQCTPKVITLLGEEVVE